jgi:GrpB-like predicted nucleotidyltransferase (UPF0157 family)
MLPKPGTSPPSYGRISMDEDALRTVTIGEPLRLSGEIEIADYDPTWPALFAREATRIRSVLVDRLLAIEHVGSTSVPGLAAKPRIDLLLVVANSADEAVYVPALEAAGYVLRIREPNWHDHRLLHGPDTEINAHVFSRGCPEITRMLQFRDWLRANEADRALYARTKRELAHRTWKYTQDYADAKTAVVEQILARAQRGAEAVPRSP